MANDGTVNNYTIDDTSPLFQYKPYVDGFPPSRPIQGWATFFSGSGYFFTGTTKPGDSYSGTGFHVVESDGGSVTLGFYGNAFTIFGFANCSFGVLVDDGSEIIVVPPLSSEGFDPSSAATGPDVLFTKGNLVTSSHELIILPHPSSTSLQAFYLDRVEIQIYTSSNSSSNSPSLLPTRISNQSPSISYSPSAAWSIGTDRDIPNSANPLPYHLCAGLCSASVIISNASAVSINGSCNWGGWTYTVDLQNLTSLSSSSITSSSQILNASSWWKVPDAYLYFEGGLDEKSTYNLTVRNLGDSQYLKMWLSEVTVYSLRTNTSATSSGSAPSNSSSGGGGTGGGGGGAGGGSAGGGSGAGAGAGNSRQPVGRESSGNVLIIAGVVSALTAIGLLVAVVFLVVRRKKRGTNVVSSPANRTMAERDASGSRSANGVTPFLLADDDAGERISPTDARREKIRQLLLAGANDTSVGAGGSGAVGAGQTRVLDISSNNSRRRSSGRGGMQLSSSNHLTTVSSLANLASSPPSNPNQMPATTTSARSQGSQSNSQRPPPPPSQQSQVTAAEEASVNRMLILLAQRIDGQGRFGETDRVIGEEEEPPGYPSRG